MCAAANTLIVRIFVAVAGTSALAATVAGFALFSMATSADRTERAYEQGLVVRGLTYRIEEVEKELFAHVIWDEALINTDNRYDATWVRTNVGLPLTIGYGHHAVIVLSGTDQPLYANLAKRDVSPDIYRRFQRAAAPLIAKVRKAEALAFPTRDVPPMLPNHASVAALIDGVPMLITASLFQQDNKAQTVGATAPILITALPFGDRILPHFSRRYALINARVTVGPPASESALAAVPTAPGSPPIRLEWQPRRPGSDLLHAALPPLAAAVLLVALGSAILFGITRKAVERVLASEAEARHMARHDVLTGVGNRILFAERYQAARAAAGSQQQGFAVLVIDLDHFKAVNDTYGHDVGDAVIHAAASALASVATAGDTVVRLGGDEFALLHAPIDEDRLGAYCQHVLNHTSCVVATSAGSVAMSCTIGAALIDATVSMSEALRSADLALYTAKRAGRGRHALYDPELESLGDGRVEQQGLPPARRLGQAKPLNRAAA